MCGICGIIDPRREITLDNRKVWVQAMNDAMHHRGPDAEGIHHDERASLAMRRLAIIDLESGHQPIFNETGEIGVVFNGEIYNYQELKVSVYQATQRLWILMQLIGWMNRFGVVMD